MQPLLLLHGAIGAEQQLKPLADKLARNFKVYTYGFPGHGGKPVTSEPFSIKLFADSVLQYLEEQQLDKNYRFSGTAWADMWVCILPCTTREK